MLFRERRARIGQSSSIASSFGSIVRLMSCVDNPLLTDIQNLQYQIIARVKQRARDILLIASNQYYK